MKSYLLFMALFSLLISWDSFAENCQEVRMGLDIGSGSTKILVAKVDYCHNKIVEVLHSESRSTQYNEDLEKNSDGSLSPAMIEVGFETLKSMVSKGRIYKPKRSYGVATSVFRKAKNGMSVIKTFARQLKMRLKVIDQKEEAMLGYFSALALRENLNKAPDIIVWDIGGGSMQMFGMDEKERPKIYLGDLASVTFKNMVVEVIQSKKLDAITTPNPIGEKREQVIALARSYARIHVPLELKSLLKDHQIIGVGGVHNQSIKNQMQLKETKYTLEELENLGKRQVLKRDEDLEGNYRATDVTNLLLVQGFMEGLGIKEVKILNANLLQGLMFR